MIIFNLVADSRELAARKWKKLESKVMNGEQEMSDSLQVISAD